MATIAIGQLAINRVYGFNASGTTSLNRGTACKANATGKITLVYRYSKGVRLLTPAVTFGIFYWVSGTTYKCRSTTGNLGPDLVLGYNSWVVSLDVVEGDFIGQWITAGYTTAYDTTAPINGYLAQADGDVCTVGLQSAFADFGAQNMSFGGSGTTPPFIAAYNTGGILAGKRLVRGFGW